MSRARILNESNLVKLGSPQVKLVNNTFLNSIWLVKTVTIGGILATALLKLGMSY